MTANAIFFGARHGVGPPRHLFTSLDGATRLQKTLGGSKFGMESTAIWGMSEEPESHRWWTPVAEIQLPGLETIEKLWNWASNQGSIFPDVWANPRSYFEKFEQNENPLPAAISFFCFVLLLQIIIEFPIAIAVLNYNPLEVSTVIKLITTAVLQAGVFSFAMFILARMLVDRL
jgi:hypothetical protein